jgi:hypothetical protein
MKIVVFTNLILFTAYVLGGEETSGAWPKVEIRHKELGRADIASGFDGYTTVNLLYLVNSKNCEALFDVRGHLFNDKNLGANFGFGLRFPVFKKCLVGANLYYDCLDGKLLALQQFGVGVELLGPVVDCRLNWYRPFGKNTVFSGDVLKQFPNKGFIKNSRLSAVLPVVEGELGISFRQVYLKMGPYYVCSKESGGVHFGNWWGGHIGADINIGRRLSLGFSTHCDQKFNCCWQVGLSVLIFSGKQNLANEKQRNLRTVPIMRKEMLFITPYKDVVTDKKRESLVRLETFSTEEIPATAEIINPAGVSSTAATSATAEPVEVFALDRSEYPTENGTNIASSTAATSATVEPARGGGVSDEDGLARIINSVEAPSMEMKSDAELYKNTNQDKKGLDIDDFAFWNPF